MDNNLFSEREMRHLSHKHRRKNSRVGTIILVSVLVILATLIIIGGPIWYKNYSEQQTKITTKNAIKTKQQAAEQQRQAQAAAAAQRAQIQAQISQQAQQQQQAQQEKCDSAKQQLSLAQTSLSSAQSAYLADQKQALEGGMVGESTRVNLLPADQALISADQNLVNADTETVDYYCK